MYEPKWTRGISRISSGIVLGIVAAACSAGSDGPGGRGSPSAASVGGAGNDGAANAAAGSAGSGNGGSAVAGQGGGQAGAGGGSGGASAGGGAVSNPTPGVNPRVDPSIMFDWPETNPALTCLPGHYAGAFQGTYAFDSGFYTGNYPISGNITLVLAQSQNGEQLDISDGHITGTSNFTIPFSVDLNGTLDCTQAKLINGKLVNGVYAFAAQQYHFEGDIAADYDKQAHQFVNGVWSVHEPAVANNHGAGTWQAAYTGP